MSFRAIQRGARVRLAKFCSHYLLSPWIRVALLLCVLEVTLRLLSSLGGLAAPSTVRPELIFEMPQGSHGATFARRYRPPFGVQVWSPDILTSYVVPVPKMVCFFEVAFDNGLPFPLHPFIKGVLQHFNVCPSQLSPNCWGILVGLLVFFRDRGLGVPSIALFLDLFSAKETTEGFLYFSRRTGAPHSNLRSSIFPQALEGALLLRQRPQLGV